MKNRQKLSLLTVFGGGRWIRTTEGIASRFTVCPLWPLGNSPIFICADWSWWTDSNPRPADYKSAALPTELHQHLTGIARVSAKFLTPERLFIIADDSAFVNSFFQKNKKTAAGPVRSLLTVSFSRCIVKGYLAQEPIPLLQGIDAWISCLFS